MNFLSATQALVSKAVLEGHNVFVSGKGGTGKTFLLNSIVDSLPPNKRFHVTCTTGAACNNLTATRATTLHSFAGVGQFNGTKEQVLARVRQRNDAVSRIISCELLFVDEISMLSRRNLEILGFVLSQVRDNQNPFGGIQIVSFGDFKQLPPVPSSYDCGEYAFLSKLWRATFTHNFVLTNVRRQTEQEFIKALSELADGISSASTRGGWTQST